MEVKCPPELREIVYCSRKTRKPIEKSPAGAPTKPDHLVGDGEKAVPIKKEVPQVISPPAFSVNDAKPSLLNQTAVPFVSKTRRENIGLPADKVGVNPTEQVAAGNEGDSGTPGKIGTGGTRVDEPIVIDD